MKKTLTLILMLILIACSSDLKKEDRADVTPNEPNNTEDQNQNVKAPDAQTQLMIEKVAASVN